MSPIAHPVTAPARTQATSKPPAGETRVARTREQIEAWFCAMDALEAGEVIPGGRDQETLSALDDLPKARTRLEPLL